jgi:Protein of unknown function (DUF5818)
VSKRGRIRLGGNLRKSRRGLLIETSEKKIWVLDFLADVEVPQTKSVIIEGTQAGFDRISVDWAASSSDG